MFADDLVIYSHNLKQLQSSLNCLDSWCQVNKIFINPVKSKIIKFRKGGRLKGNDKANIGTEEIEFVNEYDYLEVRLQTTLTLTKHINLKSKKMAQIIGSLKHLQKLKLDTAIKIYNVTSISPPYL